MHPFQWARNQQCCPCSMPPAVSPPLWDKLAQTFCRPLIGVFVTHLEMQCCQTRPHTIHCLLRLAQNSGIAGPLGPFGFWETSQTHQMWLQMDTFSASTRPWKDPGACLESVQSLSSKIFHCVQPDSPTQFWLVWCHFLYWWQRKMADSNSLFLKFPTRPVCICILLPDTPQKSCGL